MLAVPAVMVGPHVAAIAVHIAAVAVHIAAVALHVAAITDHVSPIALHHAIVLSHVATALLDHPRVALIAGINLRRRRTADRRNGDRGEHESLQHLILQCRGAGMTHQNPIGSGASPNSPQTSVENAADDIAVIPADQQRIGADADPAGAAVRGRKLVIAGIADPVIAAEEGQQQERAGGIIAVVVAAGIVKRLRPPPAIAFVCAEVAAVVAPFTALAVAIPFAEVPAVAAAPTATVTIAAVAVTPVSAMIAVTIIPVTMIAITVIAITVIAVAVLPAGVAGRFLGEGQHSSGQQRCGQKLNLRMAFLDFTRRHAAVGVGIAMGLLNRA